MCLYLDSYPGSGRKEGDLLHLPRPHPAPAEGSPDSPGAVAGFCGGRCPLTNASHQQLGKCLRAGSGCSAAEHAVLTTPRTGMDFLLLSTWHPWLKEKVENASSDPKVVKQTGRQGPIAQGFLLYVKIRGGGYCHT